VTGAWRILTLLEGAVSLEPPQAASGRLRSQAPRVWIHQSGLPFGSQKEGSERPGSSRDNSITTLTSKRALGPQGLFAGTVVRAVASHEVAQRRRKTAERKVHHGEPPP
jgi:hypothetical protein